VRSADCGSCASCKLTVRWPLTGSASVISCYQVAHQNRLVILVRQHRSTALNDIVSNLSVRDHISHVLKQWPFSQTFAFDVVNLFGWMNDRK